MSRPGAGSAVEVTVSTGRVRGTDLGDVVRFYGIPYAEDPVGDLRFA
ncbi:carboxylesterase family protein, partial [Dietzia lutea]